MEMKVFLFSNQASDPAGLSASTPVFNAVGKGGNATVYYSWKTPGEDELANVDRSETVVSPMLPPPRCYYTNVNAQLSIFVRLGGGGRVFYSIFATCIVFPSTKVRFCTGSRRRTKPSAGNYSFSTSMFIQQLFLISLRDGILLFGIDDGAQYS